MKRRWIGLSGALSYLLLPAALAAQVAGGVELFGTLNNSSPITRTLGGLSLSVGTPFVGIRGSGALGASSFGDQTGFSQPSASLVWATDADLVLGPLNARLGEGFMPYAFGGVGMMSAAEPIGFTDAIRTWSYGAGIQLALGSILSVNGEGRWRHLAAIATPADSQFVRGTEFRVGIGLHFGGGHRPSYAKASPRSRTSSSRPPSAPRPSRTTGTIWPTASTTSARAAARRVVPDAERFIGVPYRYGGTSPQTGFDCSGLVQYVYAEEGINLPRTSRQMAAVGRAVEPSTRSLAVGDLMLFAQGGTISHVAIYAGNGRFIHSSSSGHGVRYDDLGTRRGKWFADHMVAARRVAGEGSILSLTFADGSVIAFDHLDPPDSAPPPPK